MSHDPYSELPNKHDVALIRTADIWWKIALVFWWYLSQFWADFENLKTKIKVFSMAIQLCWLSDRITLCNIWKMCKKIFKYHLVMSKTIALIRHPSLLFSLYPEVKNHRSYSAPSLLFFRAEISKHLSYSARFSISFIWQSGVSYKPKRQIYHTWMTS